MGCAISSDEPPSYGTPTDATTIHLVEANGFAGPSYRREVRIEGTAATYRYGDKADHATIAIEDVAEIVHALEEIEFLELDGDYTTCKFPATDASEVTIEVALPAGPQTVKHYLGCSGGVFDELDRLDRQIYDLSGFSAWLARQ